MDDLYYIKNIPNFDLLKKNRVTKRLQHEIISIQKCIDYNVKVNKGSRFTNIDPTCIEFIINDKDKVTFHILFKYKYTISLQLIFTSEYPFRSPECIMLNGCDNNIYKILLARISEHYYKQGNAGKCLCCNTVLCRDNWNPGTKITCLLEEVNTNTTYMYDIVYAMLKNKIYDKHLGYRLYH